MQWRLLLEEFGPEILYIKQIHNTVVDAISQLDIVSEAPPYTNTKQQMRFSMRLFTSTGQSEEALKIGAKRGKDHIDMDREEAFMLDLEQVSQEQNQDKELQSIVKSHQKSSMM